MIPLLIFLVLTIISIMGVRIIRGYIENHSILDYPNERSSHILPTPRGGGLVIVLIVTAFGIWAMFISEYFSHGLIYLVCGVVIAWLGWQDDVHSLSPRVRFGVQGLVALISVVSIGYFKSVTIPLFGQLQLGIFGYFITFLWIIGLINAYNFMDASYKTYEPPFCFLDCTGDSRKQFWISFL